MARYLVVVHGMGVNRADWVAAVVAQLNAVAARYPAFADGPPPFLLAASPDDDAPRPTADQTVVVAAGYDAELRAHVERFQRDTEAVLGAAAGAGIALPGDVAAALGTLDRAGETERNAFWSHVVDVLLYRAFPLVTQQLRVTVLDALARVLQRRDADVSVLAHSLGTAVVHDALSDLARGADPRFAALRPPGVRLAHLFMCANVSRLLERALVGDLDVHQSPVAPLSVRGRDAMIAEYWNFRHVLDPFARPRRFAPPWPGDDFHPVDPLQHVADFNVHALAHYLDSPEVHVPMLNALAGFARIDPATERAAVAAYRAQPEPPCAAELRTWRETARAVGTQLESRPTLAELLLGGVRFLAAARAARDACGAVAPQFGGIVA